MGKGLAPAGVVFLGLVVSLAVLGIGYGLWSDTLRISGAVSTGAVNAVFAIQEIDEGLKRGDPNGPADNGINEDKEMNGLDTAACRAGVLGVAAAAAIDTAAFTADDLVSVKAGDRLLVFIRNGYPSFNCYVDFTVQNAGSIPIKVRKPALGRYDASALAVEFQRCYEDGEELAPGKEAPCTLHVHIERGAQPNTVYRFGATVCAYQWNADGPVICPEISPVPAPQPVPAPAPLTPVNTAPRP